MYWVCLAAPETSVFVPFYLGMSQFPAGYAQAGERPSQELFDRRVGAGFRADPFEAFWTFANFRQQFREAPEASKARIGAEAEAIEDWALRLVGPMTTTAAHMSPLDHEAAVGLLENFSHNLITHCCGIQMLIAESRPLFPTLD